MAVVERRWLQPDGVPQGCGGAGPPRRVVHGSGHRARRLPAAVPQTVPLLDPGEAHGQTAGDPRVGQQFPVEPFSIV